MLFIIENKLSLEDDETMQATLEIFSGMTNVRLVATRLTSRQAIKREAFESVKRKLTSGEEDASVNAASELSVCIKNLQ